MPFTLSHPAAAIPFLRTRLVPSALVIGCMVPDFMYFIRLSPQGKLGHTLPGVFIFDLPVAFIALWLFHAYAKGPLYAWLPESVRRRIQPGPAGLEVGSFAQFLLLAASILVGVATHILWDSFTHQGFWPYRHWQFLHRMVPIPGIGQIECRRVIQHASTIFGAIVLLLWFRHWYRKTEPKWPDSAEKTGGNRRAALVAICAVALAAAILRGFLIPLAIGSSHFQPNKTQFERAVIAAISVFWLGVVVYGAVKARAQNEPRDA